jgi:hypothetical protein
MRLTTFRKFAAGAALAMLAVLPACAFPHEEPGTGQFIGLGVNVTGVDAGNCSWAPRNPHSISVDCDDVDFRSTLDWRVVLSFTGHGYEATVRTTRSSNIGLRWREFDPSHPDANEGVISGNETVVLRGGSVPDAPLWGIKFASNNLVYNVNFIVDITCVPQPGNLCPA